MRRIQRRALEVHLVTDDLTAWKARPMPDRRILEGRYARLEPLEAERHGDGLFDASTVADATTRFCYLSEYPPASREAFTPWLEKAEASKDALFFAVIDKASGKVSGRQSLMRIDTQSGVIEIGQIYWGPQVSRTPAATEAQFLFAHYVFDELGFRRYEWKCHNSNEPSKRAALRFGFKPEGVFRQHMVFKGGNRDTAWFSIIDQDWPALRRAYEAWLDPSNFDAGGRQRRRLEDFQVDFGAK
jgi:RimJ/RimL family protein N-acetyltransferase